MSGRQIFVTVNEALNELGVMSKSTATSSLTTKPPLTGGWTASVRRSKKSKSKKSKSKKKKGGYKPGSGCKQGGGTSTVRVTNQSNKQIFLRMYKVDETMDPRSISVNRVIGPLSAVVTIDAATKRPVPITYTTLTWSESFTPGIRTHLYWSTCKSDMDGDQPFGGDVQHFDRDHQRIISADFNAAPITLAEGTCVTAATEEIPPPPPSSAKMGGKKMSNNKKQHYRGVIRYRVDTSDYKYNRKTGEIQPKKGNALVNDMFASNLISY